MGLIIGPTPWWQSNLVAACPAGTTLLDGSRIICKAGGTAWIVAPSCTQVSSAWAGGQYNSTQVGDKCCVSEWSGVQAQLISCGFNPCDWFVPCNQLLYNPGYVCRSNWDSFSIDCYWSATDGDATQAYFTNFATGCPFFVAKSCSRPVRVMRCVTY